MEFVKTTLKEELVVKKVITIHYFEYAKDYVYEGEKHDFWEFVYVDKGEVEVMAETVGYRLRQGEIIFHKPNEFHNLWANGRIAPNLIVVTFECKSEAIKYFENKIMNIDDFEKNLLAQIVKGASTVFASNLGDTHMTKLDRRPSAPFGGEQLIKLSLEQLLICLIRRGQNIKKESRMSSSVKKRSYNDATKKIIQYMKDHISSGVTFNDIRRISALSDTNLKTLFREVTGMGVMEYFRSLKIEEAKRLIREEDYNFTEIADQLSYTSIHYFSRHFKRHTGMSPSEYASSIKAKMQENLLRS